MPDSANAELRNEVEELRDQLRQVRQAKAEKTRQNTTDVVRDALLRERDALKRELEYQQAAEDMITGKSEQGLKAEESEDAAEEEVPVVVNESQSVEEDQNLVPPPDNSTHLPFVDNPNETDNEE